VPDLFWRIERNVDLQNDKDYDAALDLTGRFDPHAGIRTSMPRSWMRARPGSTAPSVSSGSASAAPDVASRRADPACAVAYYGVRGHSRPSASTTLLQFGRTDVFILRIH
jgi:hypothetical protein